MEKILYVCILFLFVKYSSEDGAKATSVSFNNRNYDNIDVNFV